MKRRSGVRSLCSSLCAGLLLTCSCTLAAKSGEFDPGRRVGVVQSDLVREASGIVASRQNPGVLWVHNDSGDSARIFAINDKAEFLGVCNFAGVTARDWEDIAVGPGPEPNQPYLYIGDIGDNDAIYPGVTVYRVPEPRIDPAVPFKPMEIGPADAIRLTYPDGPRDAETLLVDPQTRDLYIISKREMPSKVYLAVYPQSTTEPTKMKRVTKLPWGFAVAGDVSPDGRRVIVRGMLGASLWVRPAGEPLWRAFEGKRVRLALPRERQGEGICFDAQGAGYFTIGESHLPPLYYFGPTEPNVPRR
ncbi:MAG: hypothetical protein KBE65_01925 [Phycisphaerae bacterium]|nr:hypothetical protein [Phycisphaerae bacterium]